ncbi:MAG: hypothetical protein HYZ28_23070 [Myxococcales bacterium]|nr:hypothetical protein [Myxococcales bacterium]
MPALLLHLTAVERLSAEAEQLPKEISCALTEDIEYARLGAALSDLPEYGGLLSGWREPPRFCRLFHARAPVGLGLKMAELVAMGALVGTEAGMAFVSGYFTHLCLDRQLNPLVERLAARQRRPRETLREAHRRIEWLQALFFLRELHGSDLMGTRLLRSKLQISKRRGFPTQGIGRGLYELVRLSSREALREAPTKEEMDSWVRGLYLHGLFLSSPLGRLRGLPSHSGLSERELYRGPEVDFPAELKGALEVCKQVLGRLASFIRRGSFTRRTRERFLAELPEGSIDSCAA